METIFYKVLEMSSIASFVIGIILILRLALKKHPKLFTVTLWAVALFKLLVPIKFKSNLSVLPNNFNNYILNKSEYVEGLSFIVKENIQKGEVEKYIPVHLIIYFSVVLGIVIYGIFSMYKLKKALKNSAYYKENIYKNENIDNAFVLGIIKPKIYIPEGLTLKEESYIIKHEQIHIKRFDYINKILWYGALAIHWFNPFVWVAFNLASKDIEMACDEGVIKTFGEKKEYSKMLLDFAAKDGGIKVAPIAFGNGEVKGRIKNILNYKKPKFWILIVVALGVCAFVISLITEPVGMVKEIGNVSEVTVEGEKNNSDLIEEYKDYIEIEDYAYRGNDEIEKLIYETQRAVDEKDKMYKGEFNINSLQIHGVYKEEDRLKIFVTVLNERYIMDSKKVIHNMGGSLIPRAITYKIEEDNKYKVEEYKMPLDGDMYAQSIKEMMYMPISKKKVTGLKGSMIFPEFEELNVANRKNLIETVDKAKIKNAKIEEINDKLETEINILKK